MSLALNGSSSLQRFERGNVVEVYNGIMFDFYPGLPQVVLLANMSTYILVHDLCRVFFYSIAWEG